MALSEKYKTILDNAVSAIHKRTFTQHIPNTLKPMEKKLPKADRMNSMPSLEKTSPVCCRTNPPVTRAKRFLPTPWSR